VKGRPAGRSGSDREIADPYVYTHDLFVALKGWIRNLYLKGHEQVEPFLVLIIPEPGIAKRGSLLNKRHMRVLALVGEYQTSLKRIQADLVLRLEGVITLIGILHRG
jgi:hypothetical protein